MGRTMSSHDGDAVQRRGAKLILGGLAAGAVLGTVVGAPAAQAAGPAPAEGTPPGVETERTGPADAATDAAAAQSDNPAPSFREQFEAAFEPGPLPTSPKDNVIVIVTPRPPIWW